ncbi:MAG: VacJ family lipoprotein [Rhodospirillales bacterium]|nr:VacJ family lipoprotein [Rhodospirillales bacterium]MBO6788821.1 VacJ family lipoprotein [Rhodospirillales bacterium]
MLEPFGGSAHPDAVVNTKFGELSATALPAERTLLAQATSAEDDVNDPLEPVNRVIFEFNEAVYAVLLTPIAKTYNTILPETMRAGVGNLVDHLASPVTFVNDLLQFELHRAMTTVARFVVNTVIGMGGIADVASGSGLEKHEEDFGQTLGVYGMGEGLYLVLPLLGPTNPRDAVGKYVVDPFFDPLGLYLSNTDRDAESWARTGVSAVDEYAGLVDELEQIKKTSVDYYAAIRSLYRQKRQTEISNGREEDLPQIPNYDLNFGPDSNGSIAGVK